MGSSLQANSILCQKLRPSAAMDWHNAACTKIDLVNFGGGQSCLACGSVGPPAGRMYPAIDQTREIRMLKLMPGAFADKVVCEISTAALSSQPEYDAISYTWALESGDVALSEKITVGGASLRVTKNCEKVLKRVRRQFSTRTVWIDAVCIDQDDVSERGHQVQLMPKIYSGARSVLVYIGEPEAKHNISSAIGHLGENPNSANSRFITSLKERYYFSRLWTLQEIALARTATMICGDETVPWDTLRSAAAGFPKRLLPIALRFEKHIYANPDNLLDLLLLARQCQASDPRDKVFAILGLLPSGRIDDIEADYTLTTEQVYTRVALHLAKTRGWKSVLTHAGLLGRESSLLTELPSWVPDWSIEIAEIPKLPSATQIVPTDGLTSPRHPNVLDLCNLEYDQTTEYLHAKVLRLSSCSPQWFLWNPQLAKACSRYLCFPNNLSNFSKHCSLLAPTVEQCYDEFCEFYNTESIWGDDILPLGIFTATKLDMHLQSEDMSTRDGDLEFRLYRCEAENSTVRFKCLSIDAAVQILTVRPEAAEPEPEPTPSEEYREGRVPNLSGVPVIRLATLVNRVAHMEFWAASLADGLKPSPEPPRTHPWSYEDEVKRMEQRTRHSLAEIPPFDDDLEELWMEKFKANNLARLPRDRFTADELDPESPTYSKVIALNDSLWRLMVRLFSMREVSLNIR